MPWKEICPMDEKVQFIAACLDDENFSQLCRRFGISRKTGYKWLQRYNEVGLDGLKDRPPISKMMPHRTSAELIEAIIAFRKLHPFWGPKKLRASLVQQEPKKNWPAASTIGEMLKRYGLIRPRRRRLRAPPGSSPLSACEEPNDVWCIDFKGHFALGDKTRCHPLTLSDAATRYLLKCEGLSEPRGPMVRHHLELAFREFGLPSRIRSDNGPPFATLAPGGLSSLSVWWIKLGIVPERIQPGHPEQNGRHERMHRTLKMEVTHPPMQTMAEQQRAFDRFRREYNDERPHEALGLVPPAKRYRPSSRLYPSTLEYPEYVDCIVRWTHPRSGSFNFRHQVIPLARALGREPIGLKQVGETIWEVFYGPVLLGVIDERDKPMKLRHSIWRDPKPATAACVPVSVSPSSEFSHPPHTAGTHRVDTVIRPAQAVDDDQPNRVIS